MKSSTFSLMLVLLSTMLSVAQETYLSLLQPDAVWSIRHLRSRYVGYDPDTRRDIYVRDTLTKHYSIDLSEYIPYPRKMYPVYVTTDSVFSWDSPNLRVDGYISEENRRVYYTGQLNQTGRESIYDFNLLPGDTVLTTESELGEPIAMIISNIDTTVLADGIPRRRWHTAYRIRQQGSDRDTLIPLETTWVEGIGDLKQGLISYPDILPQNDRFLDRLLCFQKQGEVVYQSPQYQNCFIEYFAAADTAAYLPMLRPDAEWSVVHLEWVWITPDRARNNYFTEHYRLGGDSLYQGKIWRKLYFSMDTVFRWEDPELRFGGLVREEDRRVFYQGPLRRNEMMYDFNLAEGDVFWHGTDDTGAPHSLFVHRISTVHLADSIPRRRIHLRYYDHVFGKIWDEDTSIWIEGIGDARHGILAQRFTWSFSNVREADKLICYKNDDGLIFDSPNYDGCFFEQIISATREVSDIKVNIYPNPSTDNFYLSFPDQEPIDRLVIYDSRGRGVYRAVNIPTTDSWRVDAADWPAGVYFMRMFQRGRVATAKLVRVE